MSEGRPTIDPARPEGSERLGIMGGFRSETHVVVALWSAEALHMMLLREQTFRAVCCDPTRSPRGGRDRRRPMGRRRAAW
ncbi:hypothetical protein BH24CHL8_BH24CHL8_05710 [soil metagenome]